MYLLHTAFINYNTNTIAQLNSRMALSKIYNVEVKMDSIQKIKTVVESAPIVLFMKGSPQFPQCGFSMRTERLLRRVEPSLSTWTFMRARCEENLPKFSEWPTFPQLFVKGELVGGCDIVLGMFQSGELQTLLEDAQAD